MYSNKKLEKLQSYPFERLNTLLATVKPSEAHAPISLSIGEPKHKPPEFALSVLSNKQKVGELLSTYPATKGGQALREAISDWLKKRFQVKTDKDREILPVNGTREALFSFAQATLTGKAKARVIMPNPFYQIYEGAALLAGATPYFCSSFEKDNYQQDFDSISPQTWEETELIYVCSPGNPTGISLSDDQYIKLIELAHKHDFCIVSDECYSEIYLDNRNKPNSLLAVSEEMGNKNYEKCVVFHSLSKRSNLPGLRSGFVAGDADLIKPYLLYRTYHGCAMAGHVQEISSAAWSDEVHVTNNRKLYMEKFDLVEKILKESYQFKRPQGGFYHWLKTPLGDENFCRNLIEQYNVTAMPGSFLSRPDRGSDPGKNHVRIAWVGDKENCQEAACRLTDFAKQF